MSTQDQDQEIGRLVREQAERKHQQVAVQSRLKRIGIAFQQAALFMNGPGDPSQAKQQLSRISSEADLSSVIALIDEDIQLRADIKSAGEHLKRIGIEG
jgi:hypothetical protein